MKFPLVFLCLLFFSTISQAQVVDIKDGRFLNALIQRGVDQNNDGEIQATEALLVDTLSIINRSINSVEGINSFRNLRYFDCSKNNLDTLNVDSLNILGTLKLSLNRRVSTLNVSNNTLLEHLDCGNDLILSLHLNNNPKLRVLSCWGAPIMSLDITNNPDLVELDCSSCRLPNLNLSNNGKLEIIRCWNNELTTIDVTHISSLTVLDCPGNMITSLDISNNPDLTDLNIANNDISEISLQNNSSLINLDCNHNELTELDISTNAKLENIYCASNILSSLDISKNPKVFELYCQSNVLTSITGIANHQSVTGIICPDNLLATLDVSGCPILELVWTSDNSLNNLILTNCPKLHTIRCDNNLLATLNVNSNPGLRFFDCFNNSISTLDLSNNIELININCTTNNLSELDVSKNPNLNQLSCSANELDSLDVRHNILLKTLQVSSNNLLEIELSENPLLEVLSLDKNIFNTLDISFCPLLRQFTCSENKLEILNLKNGGFGGNISSLNLSFDKNPNLKYVCVDDYNLQSIEEFVNDYEYDDCVVNSYCSFFPGGDYNIVKGTVYYDDEGDGCDSTDSPNSDLLLSIQAPFDQVGFMITNNQGRYFTAVADKFYAISPILENPNYFLFTPDSFTVIFPADSSPAIQNFCLTSNGLHSDLEVTIVPITQARPGFWSVYNIVYKNKGTTSLSGTVSIDYDETLMRYILSSQVVDTSMSGRLSWEYDDLQPFESRSLNYTLELNSPTDTPPLNGDDILTFLATVYPIANDETPTDNEFELKQTVVNSYDPNDKTCLEGSILHPDMIGDFVHYLIRFENNGTADAVNIVIKDEIDLLRFDIQTLSITDASHDFFTRISEGNQVEFVFEDINLPYADEFNDGYIAFKVKTWPTLAIGDSLLNSAEIYFDFNFPVLTNTSTASFDEISAVFPFIESKDAPLVFPNPIKGAVTVMANSAIKTIHLTAANGQSILNQQFNKQQITFTLDCTMLPNGLYMIQIVTERGTFMQKVVKN